MVIKSKEFHKNNPLYDTNTAIIVTSHQGHLMFLKYALSQYMKTGKYVICSYDRHGETIPGDVMAIPHAWTFKHSTFGAEKRNGWLWDVVYGAGIIELFDNIEYVVIANSDCIWDRPDNIDNLLGYLGSNDLMSCSSDENVIHTCNMVWSTLSFLRFVENIIVNLNNNIPESYSPEVLLRDWVKKNNIKVKHMPIQPRYPDGHFYGGAIDHYSGYNQDCTWKQMIGYRNLGGEFKVGCQEHLEPIPREYFDLRERGEFFNKHERETLYYYLLLGDRRFLYKYWAEGEDSYWNRRYYPIDYYGHEKLRDDSKRKELGPPSERLGHFDRFKYNSYVLKDDEYHSKWKEVIENENKKI